MKKLAPLLSLLCCQIYHSQQRIGIGTSRPETELHVTKSVKTTQLKIKDLLVYLGPSENYSFLVKSPSHKITTYNEAYAINAVAPINIIQYKISCDTSDNDWVNEYNTKIKASKFLVVISSFSFNLAITTGVNNWITPIPQIFASQKNDTWHIKADYQDFTANTNNSAGVWTINLLVIDRTYAKEFNISQSLSNGSTGSASIPLVD